jgi:hypothetical protein
MGMANSQLNMPPMALNRVGNGTPTPAKSVGIADLAALILRAGDRLGLQRKELAAVFDLSEPDFSAAFSPNRLDRNRLMKQALPMALARELALVLCEATGLAVGGVDTERHALADLLKSAAEYIRVAGNR